MRRGAGILRELKTACDLACQQGRGSLDPVWLADMARRYTAAVTVGFNVSSSARNEVDKKHNALARRMLAQDDILRFAYDLRVPFDNNESERSIRMVKLRQKISGTMEYPKAHKTSSPSGPICKPQPNKAATPSTSSPNSSKTVPGYPQPPDVSRCK